MTWDILVPLLYTSSSNIIILIMEYTLYDRNDTSNPSNVKAVSKGKESVSRKHEIKIDYQTNKSIMDAIGQ